jgi:hypothetical protein
LDFIDGERVPVALKEFGRIPLGKVTHFPIVERDEGNVAGSAELLDEMAFAHLSWSADENGW